MVAFIAASAWHYVRRYARLAAPHAVRELKLTSNSNLEIFQNEWKTAELVGEQFVHPWLTIIRCRSETDRWPIAIVILHDKLDAEQFRMLRAHLNWRL